VDAMETSLPRLRRLAVSVQTFRRLAFASALMLTLIVASGATVRLTGSGLGCKHWPGCTAGDPFPSSGYHSYIEFGNRVIASLTILATLGAFAGALLLPSASRWVRVVAGAAFLGTLGQAPLGAITVYYHLNPWLVLSHFLLSMVVIALGVIVALEAFGVRGEPVPVRLRKLTLLAGAALGALIVSGTLATAAGPHSGGTDVRRIGVLQDAVWLHVRAVAVFGISFALLSVWLAVRRSRHLNAALALLGLLAAEMVLGEVQYRTRLPSGLVLVHVLLAAVIWAAAVAFVARIWRPWRVA
jgi:cytochrome c oxidase assembly protein subunit 15